LDVTNFSCILMSSVIEIINTSCIGDNILESGAKYTNHIGDNISESGSNDTNHTLVFRQSIDLCSTDISRNKCMANIDRDHIHAMEFISMGVPQLYSGCYSVSIPRRATL